MKIRYISLLAVAALSLAACQPDNSPEGKKKQLTELKQQQAELKAKIDQLEKEVGGSTALQAASAEKTVETIQLAQAAFAHYVEIQGAVESDENVMVAPEIPGLIVRRLVEEGQPVKAGQVIAEIDAESVRKNMAELETRMEMARTAFERQENLWKQQVGTEMQYLQAKNQKEALERSLATLKSQLGKAYVKAPISGTLEVFMQKVGEMGNPAMPLARIINVSSLKINADLSESYLKSVKRGDEVAVAFPSVNKEMKLRIQSTGQVIDPNNRTFKIQMQVPNPDGMLKPNMLSVVKIRDYYQPQAIAVPTYLIQQSASGERFVYALRQKDGKPTAERVVIEIGQTYQGQTEVSKGLQANDVLISKGYNEVSNGETVKVASPAAKG